MVETVGWGLLEDEERIEGGLHVAIGDKDGNGRADGWTGYRR